MARNPRAAAQRATAKAVREHRTQLPGSITRGAIATRESYLQGVMNGTIPEPKDKRTLARAAGKAAWGKGDPAYEGAFSKYWYHDKDHWNSETNQYDYPGDEYEEQDEAEDED